MEYDGRRRRFFHRRRQETDIRQDKTKKSCFLAAFFYLTAIASTSTITPNGNLTTAKAALAGGSEVKY